MSSTGRKLFLLLILLAVCLPLSRTVYASCADLFRRLVEVAPSIQAASREVPTLASSLQVLVKQTGRFGLLNRQLKEVEATATRIVTGTLASNEAIPVEYFDVMRAALNAEYGPLKNGRHASEAGEGVRRSDIATCKGIRDVLNSNREAFDRLAQNALINELISFQYVMGRPVREFDPYRHSQLRDFSDYKHAEGQGFVKAPHERIGSFPQRRGDPYLPPGSHLIGLETLIEMYTPEGMRFVRGEMLGSVNNNWETFIIREVRTGEEILLSARRRGGQGNGLLHSYYIKPGAKDQRTQTQFREAFESHSWIASAGSSADYSGIGKGTQAFFINYPGYTKVVVGRGRMTDRGGSLGEYRVVIEANDGHTYFLNYDSLVCYTAESIPDQPVETFFANR